MRREGRVRGKPSSKSRHSKSGKSAPKRLKSNKRITAHDPALTDFEDNNREDDEVVDLQSFIPSTMNSVIEMALSKSSEKGCPSINVDILANEEAFHGKIVGADLDILAIEEALYKQLGIFENAAEGDSFVETQFTRKWGVVLTEESWLDGEFVEFSELDEEEVDDDWFVVLDGDHG